MKTASAQASELEDDATDMKQTEYDFLQLHLVYV